MRVTVADRAAFEALESSIRGRLGVALAPIGARQPAAELGTLRGGVAWSTIKVPIALAVEARRPTDRERTQMAEMLTVSDNAAAEALWSSLGPPPVAARAVERVLEAAGDTETKVETQVVRPGFTAFGQTRWSLAAQVRLMAALPELPCSEVTRSLMRQVVPEQRWGLGTLGEEVELKGGWGPDPEGRHLVRQLGIVGLSGGARLAVAIATVPDDGTLESGTANLDQVARWLASSRLTRTGGPGER